MVLEDHLDEVHALHGEALEGDPLSDGREQVADRKLQGLLDQRDKRTRVVVQEVEQLQNDMRNRDGGSGETATGCLRLTKKVLKKVFDYDDYDYLFCSSYDRSSHVIVL